MQDLLRLKEFADQVHSDLCQLDVLLDMGQAAEATALLKELRRRSCETFLDAESEVKRFERECEVEAEEPANEDFEDALEEVQYSEPGGFRPTYVAMSLEQVDELIARAGQPDIVCLP